MNLEHPWALLLLPIALLPFLAGRGGRAAVAVAPQMLGAERSLRARLLWTVNALLAAAMALAVLAAAGPYAERAALPRRGRDIVLAIDASDSMRAVDYELDGRKASRMEAALRFAGEFIAGRTDDRVGLIAFGGRAVTQCPPTFDLDVARGLLEYIEPNMLGARTALGDAVGLGVLRLAPRGGALVVLSDGENTAGDVSPAEAARAAAEKGVRLYTVGLGTDGPVPVPVRLPSGRTVERMKDYRLDEPTLRRLAEETGGRYFRGESAGTLRSVFAAIDALERHEVADARTVPRGRWGRWLGLAATGALALACALSATALRAAPRLR